MILPVPLALSVVLLGGAVLPAVGRLPLGFRQGRLSQARVRLVH